MVMRKFIIEIHPDGTLTCCEYEDPKDAANATYNRAWLEGYRQALIHCDDELSNLTVFKGSCLSADLEYQGAVKVREHMRNFYQKLYNKYIQ
jgi:hypothetical protein